MQRIIFEVVLKSIRSQQRPCNAVRGVSEMTTQGDLVLLEKEGKVEAVHGMW